MVFEEDRKLLLIAGMKFEYQNLEIRFHKRQFSFWSSKTVKCKRGISYLDISKTSKVKLLLYDSFLKQAILYQNTKLN